MAGARLRGSLLPMALGVWEATGTVRATGQHILAGELSLDGATLRTRSGARALRPILRTAIPAYEQNKIRWETKRNVAAPDHRRRLFERLPQHFAHVARTLRRLVQEEHAGVSTLTSWSRCTRTSAISPVSEMVQCGARYAPALPDQLRAVAGAR
jgi:hypothetical protein